MILRSQGNVSDLLSLQGSEPNSGTYPLTKTHTTTQNSPLHTAHDASQEWRTQPCHQLSTPPKARMALLPRNRRKMLSIGAFGLPLQSSCWGALGYSRRFQVDLRFPRVITPERLEFISNRPGNCQVHMNIF